MFTEDGTDATFDQPLGQPMGDCAKNSAGIWERSFASGTTISFDEENFVGKIVWGVHATTTTTTTTTSATSTKKVLTTTPDNRPPQPTPQPDPHPRPKVASQQSIVSMIAMGCGLAFSSFIIIMVAKHRPSRRGLHNSSGSGSSNSTGGSGSSESNGETPSPPTIGRIPEGPGAVAGKVSLPAQQVGRVAAAGRRHALMPTTPGMVADCVTVSNSIDSPYCNASADDEFADAGGMDCVRGDESTTFFHNLTAIAAERQAAGTLPSQVPTGEIDLLLDPQHRSTAAMDTSIGRVDGTHVRKSAMGDPPKKAPTLASHATLQLLDTDIHRSWDFTGSATGSVRDNGRGGGGGSISDGGRGCGSGIGSPVSITEAPARYVDRSVDTSHSTPPPPSHQPPGSIDGQLQGIDGQEIYSADFMQDILDGFASKVDTDTAQGGHDYRSGGAVYLGDGIDEKEDSASYFGGLGFDSSVIGLPDAVEPSWKSPVNSSSQKASAAVGAAVRGGGGVAAGAGAGSLPPIRCKAGPCTTVPPPPFPVMSGTAEEQEIAWRVRCSFLNRILHSDCWA
jgi:hypothetical protein